jgi:hypothetical protein
VFDGTIIVQRLQKSKKVFQLADLQQLLQHGLLQPLLRALSQGPAFLLACLPAGGLEFDGVTEISHFDDSDITRAADQILKAAPGAVVVSGVHATLNPAQEVTCAQQLKQQLEARAPGTAAPVLNIAYQLYFLLAACGGLGNMSTSNTRCGCPCLTHPPINPPLAVQDSWAQAHKVARSLFCVARLSANWLRTKYVTKYVTNYVTECGCVTTTPVSLSSCLLAHARQALAHDPVPSSVTPAGPAGAGVSSHSECSAAGGCMSSINLSLQATQG